MSQTASKIFPDATQAASEPERAIDGAMLSMEEISHDFGSLRAVDRVTLDVQPGEVVCLLGPSGCGKSTLLRIAASLEELQQGRVFINGEDMRSPSGKLVPPERRNVGLMFQDSALFPHLTVLDNVAFGLARLPGRERRERALELLQTLGMASNADRYPHMLSGGQQQRVALARALAPKPGLMLLDEPFSALDARLRDRIRDDTLHLLKKAGAGTLPPGRSLLQAERSLRGHLLRRSQPHGRYRRKRRRQHATRGRRCTPSTRGHTGTGNGPSRRHSGRGCWSTAGRPPQQPRHHVAPAGPQQHGSYLLARSQQSRVSS
ncbi:MAG: ABC transporter ATP-binding protein, partial [Wenzhouxiangellaceae bacterium]